MQNGAGAECFTQRLMSISVSKLPSLALLVNTESGEGRKEAKSPSGNSKTVPVCRSVFGSGGGHRGGGDHQIQEGQ